MSAWSQAIQRRDALDHTACGHPKRVRDTVVSVPAHETIQEKPGSHRKGSLGQGRCERQDETEELNSWRCDSCNGTPFVHRLARAREVERLQIAQPAVDGAEVVERSAAAEVVPLDERDRETPLGGVVGDRQAADTAADDENVEGSCCEPVEIALHGREL